MTLPTLSNDSSLAAQAANQIIRYIQENNLQEGDRLPIERELMEQFHVSRSTIREAVRTLSTRNIVVVKRGSGTYVSNSTGIPEDPLGLSFAHDRKKVIADLLELRMMLEPSIASCCAERASKKDAEELWDIHLDIVRQIQRHDDYTDADIRFHCKIAECTNNDILKTLLPEITKGITLFIASTENLLLQQTIITHAQIARAIRNNDKQSAYDAMLRHLKYNQEILEQVVFQNIEEIE